eukprot:NODE_4054_length_1122_cov_82.674675_g3860_i0.p1 GENE.NODE_4054_length_1122_cov_82.674675_g3860_i0~~NODE_4054_length_1122_cov_82.674675_g3860_i0.p1  ORF type:complete len:294 (+),score=97.10 NODE_4054_length_1122_cov_82.674675_g3860_i0:57-938(+)
MSLRAFALLALVQVTAAWWCTGHMTVAEIAKQSLSDDTKKMVDEYVTYMYKQGNFTMNPTMVEAACWADDLKEDGLYAMGDWHFINLRVNPTHMKLPAVDSQNVVSIIDDLEKALKEAKGNAWVQGFSLLNLIHFVGDVHQPLHAATLFDATFPPPVGDEGGNKFMVKYQGKTLKLHQFWDSIGELRTTDPTRPLSPADQANITAFATELIHTHNFTKAQIDNYNTSSWAQESLVLATDYAYGKLKPDGVLTEAYIQKAREVCKSQIALAGLRLARQLEYVFKRNKDILRVEL